MSFWRRAWRSSGVSSFGSRPLVVASVTQLSSPRPLAGVAPLVHAGDHLRAALGDRPYREIASASYHVNPEGAQLIADAVGQRLEAELARLAVTRTGTISGTAAASP
jgi:hypothetical protein